MPQRHMLHRTMCVCNQDYVCVQLVMASEHAASSSLHICNPSGHQHLSQLVHTPRERMGQRAPRPRKQTINREQVPEDEDWHIASNPLETCRV